MELTIIADIILFFAGYLIGSILPAKIVVRLKYKKNINDIGTNNAGASNVVFNYGYKWGTFVLFFDILKCSSTLIAAYFLAKYVPMFSESIIHLSAIGVIIGHVYPIYFKFQGGKGAASLIGYLFAAMWLLPLVTFVIWYITVRKTKRVMFWSFIVVSTILGLYLFMQLAFWYFKIDVKWLEPLFWNYPWYINCFVLVLLSSFALAKQLRFI